MNQTYMGCNVTKLFHYFSVILFALIFSACGGGGGSPGSSASGGSNQTPNGKISIVLTDTNGVTSNVVSATSSLLAKVTVLDKVGAPLKGIVVTFSIDTTTAVLSPASGTALTDASGVAKMNLSSGVGTGAGTITASAIAVGTTTITTSATFSVSAPPAAIPSAINFLTAVPSDKSIVIKGAGGNGRSEVAILTFSVIDSSNNGIPNVKVNFTSQSTKAVTLSSSTGLTDASGKVTVALSSGTEPTTVRVTATVDKMAVSSVSDTITITTGAPVQTAMSVSLSAFFAEGIDFDGVRVKVAGRLADAFGGAVADGTQMVFTTDVGAVAGIGGAQCLTNGPNITTAQPFPGFCEIYWYSQNPRGTTGIANIIVTATSGAALLSQSVQLYVLGSYANIYEVTSNSFEGSTTRLGAPAPRTFTNSCNPQTLFVELVDINQNPMPPGSTVTATPQGAITLTVNPATVPMWSTPLGLLAHRGTIHSIQITPPAACNTAGANSVTETFDIKVTMPKLVVSSVNVNVSYNKN